MSLNFKTAAKANWEDIWGWKEGFDSLKSFHLSSHYPSGSILQMRENGASVPITSIYSMNSCWMLDVYTVLLL